MSRERRTAGVRTRHRPPVNPAPEVPSTDTTEVRVARVALQLALAEAMEPVT